MRGGDYNGKKQGNPYLLKLQKRYKQALKPEKKKTILDEFTKTTEYDRKQRGDDGRN